MAATIHPSIHPSRFRFRCCPCPVLCRTPALHVSLSSESMPARPHLLISVFTHSDHVFPGLPFFLVPGIGKFVIDLIQDMTRFTWSCHLSRRQRRTDVISSMPNFCSSEAEGGSSLVSDATDPTDHRTVIAAEPLQFGWFGPQVSLPWSIAEWTQASYTLPRILGETCLV